jgi:hypothetical protein
MSGENGLFIHSGVRKEAVSGLGMGPVLASKRNTFAQPGRELLQELLQSLMQPLVRKGATRYLLFDPLAGLWAQGRDWTILTRYPFYSAWAPW